MNCPTCEGKCCRDTDFGYRVEHMGAEVYSHACEDCNDGDVLQPDPRDATIAQLREAIAAWKPYWHGVGCSLFDYGAFGATCNCGADAANRARANARRMVDLEVEP